MYRKLNPLTLVLVLWIAANVFVVVAQDATQVPVDPAAQPTSDPNMGQGTIAQPEFVGDANQESAQIVLSYLQTRDPNLLGENAEFFDITTGQPTVGREPITQMQNDFFGMAFTGTLVQPTRIIAAENGWVVIEFNFSGTHTGTFRDTAATNMPVSVPMVGIFQVEGGQILSARMYYDAATINQQMGMTTTGVAAGEPATSQTGTSGQTAVTNPQALDAVLDNPTNFYGQTVTVEGNLNEFVNERMVRISDDDLLAADSLLVLHHIDGGMTLDQNARVQVTGMVRPFVLAELESELGIDLDDTLFVGFENSPMLMADSITPVQ